MGCHFVKAYRCRSREEAFYECDHCGDTADWAAHTQWLDIDQHGAGPRLTFCSTECLLDWARGSGVYRDRTACLTFQPRPTRSFDAAFSEALALATPPQSSDDE